MTVEVPSHLGYTFPPVCACCLTPTEKVGSASHVKSEAGAYTRTTSIEFPLCSECAKHVDKGCLVAVLIAVLFFLVGFIPMLYEYFNGTLESKGTDDFLRPLFRVSGALLLSYALIGPIGFWLYRTKWWPKNHPGHARGSAPVKIRSGDKRTGIIFFNEKYGEIFVEANKDKVISKR